MPIRDCARQRWESGEWCQPTPEEVRELLSKHGLSGAGAGRIIGVDGRTVRRYTAPADQKGAREIPYSAWRLLLIETGEVSDP